MGLDDYIPNEGVGESGAGSAEQAREASEKFKEQVKKASAGIKRTQKDEGKAKKQDILLASFLVNLILEKKFDDILELLFNLLDKGYSSNFLLGILSLIHIDISNKIREFSGKELIEFNYKSEEIIEFDDSNLDSKLRNRINFWVEDIILSTTSDYSHVLTKRLTDLLEKKENDIVHFLSVIFAFFLRDINITIHEDEALNISNFILLEVFKKIKELDLEEV